jgi:predicted P-loop ATPase
VELDRPIDCETPVEYEQLYAQLKQEVLRGERYWLNDEEEAEIQESNAVYYKTVTEEEIFRKLYVEADKKAEGAIFLSADDIYKEMREKFPIPTVGLKARDLAKLLPTFAKRERTSRRNGYWVIRKNPQV